MLGNLIVHLTAEFRESMWGGIATAVDLVGTAMARDGFDVFVLSCGKEAFWRRLEVGLTWIQVPWPWPSPDFLYAAEDRVELGGEISLQMAAILKQLAAEREMLVFVHNEEFVNVFELVARSANIRMVAVSHGLVEQEHPGDPSLIQQQERFLNTAELVVVHSTPQAQLLIRHYPKVRANVVPLPLALLAQEGSIARDLDQVKRRHIVAGGRGVRQKGFDVLSVALSLIQSSQPIECSVFATRGEWVQETVEEILDTGHTLRKRRWLPRSMLLDEMSCAHAVVVPSRFEPLGLVAAEAMSLGVPVVVSRVGGLRDLVGDDTDVGLCVTMDVDGPNPEALAEAICCELDSEPRVSAGHRRLEDYSYQRFLSSLKLLSIEL